MTTVVILLGILIHALLLCCGVGLLHAQLKAYSEMTKTKLLRKMTDE